MSNTDSVTTSPKMKYRFLGDSGLYVSEFSFGGMTFGMKNDLDEAYALMKHAFQHGINFFDNSEGYGNGQAEVIMGQAIQRGIECGVWERSDLVVSTKLFFKNYFQGGPNDSGLSRKHIIEGAKASLQRYGMDYVDLLFCHRADPFTPIEETVRAMNFVIEQGWAFYWGTSEWAAADIIEACEIADRLGLLRPLFDQSQYNILERSQVDYNFVTLYKRYNYGLTTWSPLASGVLTGKYNNGIPEGSRLANPMMRALGNGIEKKVPMVVQLEQVAAEVGCTLPQLSLAWCLTNKHVSTVLLGATKLAQLDENLKALRFVDKVTPEIKQTIDDIIQFQPKAWFGEDEHVRQVRMQFQ